MKVVKPNWVIHSTGGLYDNCQANPQTRSSRGHQSTPSRCILTGRVWPPEGRVRGAHINQDHHNTADSPDNKVKIWSTLPILDSEAADNELNHKLLCTMASHTGE